MSSAYLSVWAEWRSQLSFSLSAAQWLTRMASSQWMHLSPSLSPHSSPLFPPSLSSLASGNVRVCRSWVQSVIFGCGGGPQLSLGLRGLLLSLNHVTWKTAECKRVSFFPFLCVCVCLSVRTWNERRFILHICPSVPRVCCSLYIRPPVVHLCVSSDMW